ncbi:MAG: hypothetical protein ACTSRG_02630 [Candidatus Helarchaeota archaeon]
MENPKRLIAIEKKINEINEKDRKVRILGTIISSNPDFAVIDDGTGTMTVRTENPLEERKRYRIIGQIYKKADNKLVMNAEIIQDMEKLNIDLYKKVEKIKLKLKSSN